MNYVCCIDLKSFYASCECVARGLDPFKVPLAVCDTSRSTNSIVMAASPALKAYGCESRCRISEIPKNVPGLILAKPRMQFYIDTSIFILKIYLKYVSEEDIHVYSIDEAFLDLTPYLKMYKKSALELGKEIIDDVFKQTGITATCGIGNNMFMAKVAMDIGAKHKKENIDMWEEKDIKEKLWKITPLSKMWGIGSQLEKRLNRLGMHTVGDIASTDPKHLKKHFGVIGEEIYNHAWGIDDAIIHEKVKEERKSLGLGQVLFKNYSYASCKTIIKDMTFSLCYRLRKAKKVGNVVGLMIGYSHEYDSQGIAHHLKLDIATDDEKTILNSLMTIYEKYIDHNAPIRQVSISIGGLCNKEYQYSDIFADYKRQEKDAKIATVIDEIIDKYNKNVIFKASSLLEESNYIERNNLIGGHNAR